ncbi:uncharacterized protein [Chironomus tepperi]|uniref:uncharacterized protein n=1 Tax=Chironomus tepperi TaxID=113505 RepID=UPI00391F0633
MNSLIRNTLKIRTATNVFKVLAAQSRNFTINQANFKQAETETRNPEEPLKFFGSGAQTFKTKYSRVGSIDPDEIPWFQPYLVIGSVAIFMIYFCILREENDLDAQLGKSLFEQVPSLESTTLISLYKYNAEHNIDNTDVIKRLLELGIDPRQIQ